METKILLHSFIMRIEEKYVEETWNQAGRKIIYPLPFVPGSPEHL